MASEASQILEDLVRRFESAWQTGRPPVIEEYLPPTEAGRRAVLVELVHADLECRLKDGQPVRVEAYLERYPDLARDSGIVFGLVQAEYRQRCRVERGVSVAEYPKRFPLLGADLACRLQEPVQPRPRWAVGPLPSTVNVETRTTSPGRPPDPAGVPFELPSLPDYDVLEVIGRGGMGIVLKARHRVLDRLAAIKMPLAQQLTDDADRERFLREARAAARLRHPNICPIHEVGQHGQRPYLVMSFIQGETLRDWSQNHPPTPHQAARMVAALARAVGYAHEHGVIHRDIKPSNVIVDADTGQLVLMDFGLAKELSEQAIHMTHSGQVMGTPAYMAPEQAAGKKVGPAADVYSLGVVLYELVTGRLPFEGSVGDVLSKVQTQEPPPPRKLVPRLHRNLETVCLKALAKDPAGRYASAADLADDLERFTSGEAIRARREGLAARCWRRVRRRPLTVAVVLAGLLAVGAATYFANDAMRAHRRAIELDEVNQSFDRGLAAPEWTAAYLDGMETLADRLGRLSPDRADPARERLYQRFAESVRDGFSFQNKPVLQPDDITRLRAALELLAVRAPSLAASVRKEFEERLGGMQQVIDLAFPFAGLDKVFATTVQPADRTLARGKPAPKQATSEDIHTRIACQGNVELRAVFEPSWAEAAHLGLAFNAGGAHGYRFVLTAGDSAALANGKTAKPPATFAVARKRAALLRLQILRDGVVVREERVPAEEVFAGCSKQQGALRLVARREGARLTLQVATQKPVEFRDVFPLPRSRSGVFGLTWPAGVRLQTLQAWSQVRLGTPSPLERGDELYMEGRPDEALAAYRRQAGTTRDADIRRESRYKQASCLVVLQQAREAESLFRDVSLEAAGAKTADGRRWALLADGQLWLLYLRQKRGPEADAILEKLSAQLGLGFESLTGILAEEDRRSILAYYKGDYGPSLFFRKSADGVHRWEQAAKVRDVLDPLPRSRTATDEHFWTKVTLIKAYRLAGRDEDALRTCEEVFRDYGYDIAAVEEYCWILRGRGEYQRALATIDKQFEETLRVERARVYAAMKEWDKAQAELQAFFKAHARSSFHYAYFSAACLVEGFIAEERGRPMEAQAAWRKGLYRNWFRQQVAPFVPDIQTYTPTVHRLILGSLTREIDDREAEEIKAHLAAGSARALPARVHRIIPLPAAACRDMWRSPRGREWARRVAFRDLPYVDYCRVPVFLLVEETLHHQAMPGTLDRDQEGLLWQLVNNIFLIWIDGALRESDLLALALVWKGQPNLPGFGWKEVVRSLKPEVAGPLAYVIGRRYLVLKKPKPAGDFFRTALKLARAQSPLARLAQVQIERLAKKP
jgi:tRNA A-37 threonylcarbamoyl transferase component Bud32